MSAENVRIVKRRSEAFNHRDLSTYLMLSDPDIVYVQPPELPGASSYRGHEGIREYFDNLGTAWEGVSAHIEELIDVGDAVISVGVSSYRGRTSGVELDKRFAIVWRVRDGKVTRGEFFFDREEALRAAGVENGRPVAESRRATNQKLKRGGSLGDGA